jgi:transcriptional regulator with XRE-family HTH domain
MALAKRSTFGPKLRELREAARLTQAELAERAGLHPQGVVKLERGEREPAWGTVLALAAALGVSVEAFTRPPAARPRPRRGRPPGAVPPTPTRKRPRRPGKPK